MGRSREIRPCERGGRERRWQTKLLGQRSVETMLTRFFESFGVPGDQAAGFWRPAMIAKPARAIERMEACQCDRLAIADIVEPCGIPKLGPPRRLDKVDYVIDPGSDGGGMIEPSSESPKKVSRDRGSLRLFSRRPVRNGASHAGNALIHMSFGSDRSNATDLGVAGC